MRVSLILVAALAIGGCKQELEARVGGAVLPQANAVMPKSLGTAGPTVVIKPGAPVPAMEKGPIRLAVDLHVPWKELRQVLDAAAAAGARPVVLVGQRREVRGFVIDDEIDRDRYALRLTTNATGKFCLSPPGTQEAYCIEHGDRRNISSLYVREAIQKAVEEYNIMQAWVVPDPDTRWGDIVRTIDGARTCCGERPFRVAVAR